MKFTPHLFLGQVTLKYHKNADLKSSFSAALQWVLAACVKDVTMWLKCTTI